MSIAIQSISISGVEDRQLVITNDQAARVLDIGTDWDRLWIAMRLHMEDTGANIGGTPRFYAGVMSNPSSGMANGPLGAGTSNFFGIRSTFATWTRQVGPPVSYTTNFEHAVKVGAAVTESDSVAWRVSADDTIRAVAIVQIVKVAGTTWGSNMIHLDGAAGLVDKTIGDLIAAAELQTENLATASLGVDYLAGTGGDVGVLKTVDEGANGPMNAIVVAWDQSSPIHVSEVLWCKKR